MFRETFSRGYDRLENVDFILNPLSLDALCTNSYANALYQVLLIGPLGPADWVIQGDVNVILTGHWIQRTIKKSKS